MKNNFISKALALVLALMLTMGALAGCAGADNGSSPVSNTSSALSSEASSGVSQDSAVKEITVKVVDKDGNSTDFPISTQATTLREALEQENLVEGEESEYGLFIKTVNGITADDGNQEWWCLTKGGEVWNYGVDSTEIAQGDVFELTLTVGY